MSDSTTPQVAPGWYPDTATTIAGQQRWWDGTAWTTHVQNPQAAAAPYQADGAYQAVGQLRAPAGTNPSTIHIWLIVGLFALQMLASFFYLATFDMSGYMQATMDSALASSSDPSSAFAVYGYLFTPGYILVLVLGVLSYAGTIVLALFDSKTLAARGVPKPFPWMLAFIPSYGSLVYVIGRSVVVRRRTGTGLAPLFVYLGLFVLTFVVSTIWGIAAFSSIMNDFSQYTR